MKLYMSSFLLSFILPICLAAPHNAHLEERQRDKTYTITTDYPPTTIAIPSFPGGNPKPTATIKSTPLKTTAAPTSKKTTTSKYTPPSTKTTAKSTGKVTKTTAEPAGPSSTKCPVPLYYQCGGFYEGKEWTGCTVCVPGANCVWQNDFYYQCVADE